MPIDLERLIRRLHLIYTDDRNRYGVQGRDDSDIERECLLACAAILSLLDTIAELRRENERLERLGRGLQTATAEIQAENAELRRERDEAMVDADWARRLRADPVFQAIKESALFAAALANEKQDGTEERHTCQLTLKPNNGC